MHSVWWARTHHHLLRVWTSYVAHSEMFVRQYRLFLKSVREFSKGLRSDTGALHPQQGEDARIRTSQDFITPQQMTLSPGTGSINAAWWEHTCTHTHIEFILLNIKRQHTWKWLNNIAGNFTAGVPEGGRRDIDLCVMDVISTERWVVLAAMLDAMLQ